MSKYREIVGWIVCRDSEDKEVARIEKDGTVTIVSYRMSVEHAQVLNRWLTELFKDGGE